MIREFIREILIETFHEDLQNAETGREAKQIFSQYVDQNEFKKGMLVHWVGTPAKLKKIIENPRSKDEISCNFYPNGGYRDWMAAGMKKPIGVIVEGWVTYATKENSFTGYQGKRPRKKAERIAYDHQQASSGFPKRPYDMTKDQDNYLKDLRNSNRVKFKAEDMEPSGRRRQLGDDAWMGGMAGIPRHKDWNEVIVDNWKITGIVYGAVGRYGIRPGDIKKMNDLGSQYNLRVYKIGKML